MKILHTYKMVKGEGDNKTEVSVYIKKPSRIDREEMSLAYNKEFHKCLSNGISTEEMIRRAVLDGGGAYLSKFDVETLHELYKELNALTAEVEKLRLDEGDATALEAKRLEVYKQIYNIESSQKGIFDNSAEALATKKSLVWAALNLSFIKPDKDKDSYEYIFHGPTFDTKLGNYYEMCDDEDRYTFELGCFDRSYIMVERFLSGDAENEDDFKRIEEEINKFFEK